MSQAKRVAKLVGRHVLDVLPIALTAADAREEDVTRFVENDVGVDQMVGSVVPPVSNRGGAAVRFVTKEHFVLVVQQR